jgi:dTDP-4-amino-4,6-dideoxygalactose transaminase
MTLRKTIPVTRSSVPPIVDVLPLIEEIWQSRILSNGGPIHGRLEAALCQYLGVEHLTLVGNATLGLILALRQCAQGGEVITTPFSFVASAHAVRWAGAEPVFADIDPVTLNLDPEAVERQITPRTRAILAVHCFGTPCNVAGLQAVADRHGLALIYDAAHAFGVQVDGRSVLHHGDLSVLSFHATKVFSTVEGGAIISRTREAKQALDRLCNFGIADETTVEATGLNAKMSELHAAVGLAQLPHVEQMITARLAVAMRYWQQLRHVDGLSCVCPPKVLGRNGYAFPILVDPDYPLGRDALYARLKDQGIHARRYFYPLITDHPMYRDLPSAQSSVLPVASAAATRVLCLPVYPDLEPEDQHRVVDVIRTAGGAVDRPVLSIMDSEEDNFLPTGPAPGLRPPFAPRRFTVR